MSESGGRRGEHERALLRGLMRAGLVWALGVALVSITLAPALAQSREDAAPAESLGLGDRITGAPWGAAAIFANPAGLLRVPVLLVEGTYSYLDGKAGHNAGVSLVDARTNPDVAMGVSYNYFTTRPDGRDRDGNQMRIALGTGYRGQAVDFYVGLGVRWLALTIGEKDRKDGEHDDINTWTGDLGLIVEVDHRIRFGVVAQNLIDTKVAEAPRLVGFGLSFLFGYLEAVASIDLDVSGRADALVSTWGFGAELSAADPVRFRAGFVRDEGMDSERLTFGVGWSNASVSVDLGYATSLAKPLASTFALSLRYSP